MAFIPCSQTPGIYTGSFKYRTPYFLPLFEEPSRLMIKDSLQFLDGVGVYVYFLTYTEKDHETAKG